MGRGDGGRGCARRPLTAEVESVDVAPRVGDDVVLSELGALDEEGQVAGDHVEVAVPSRGRQATYH